MALGPACVPGPAPEPTSPRPWARFWFRASCLALRGSEPGSRAMGDSSCPFSWHCKPGTSSWVPRGFFRREGHVSRGTFLGSTSCRRPPLRACTLVQELCISAKKTPPHCRPSGSLTTQSVSVNAASTSSRRTGPVPTRSLTITSSALCLQSSNNSSLVGSFRGRDTLLASPSLLSRFARSFCFFLLVASSSPGGPLLGPVALAPADILSRLVASQSGPESATASGSGLRRFLPGPAILATLCGQILQQRTKSRARPPPPALFGPWQHALDSGSGVGSVPVPARPSPVPAPPPPPPSPLLQPLVLFRLLATATGGGVPS